MKLFLIIATGSGIGGVLRYAMQSYVYKLYPFSFPLGTFLVNITGCFLIGVFFALTEKNLLSSEIKLFLITGICGGFTTFSSFSYDNIILLRAGNYFYFFLYTFGSVLLGLLATYLGILLIKIL
ncbi:MAG: fluoride efflux transporter CrcB [Bacteroidetes bacterium]|nr:fluoride efflux transporter CrcB [Bacteroidota bacterium]MBS1934869.1 fluoride efflux transporter CrcB [Bacteroidota bacterium]